MQTILVHFVREKPPLVNRILLNVPCAVSLSYWNFSDIKMNTRYSEFHMSCFEWNFQPDLVPKTRMVRSNTWQPYLANVAYFVTSFCFLIFSSCWWLQSVELTFTAWSGQSFHLYLRSLRRLIESPILWVDWYRQHAPLMTRSEKSCFGTFWLRNLVTRLFPAFWFSFWHCRWLVAYTVSVWHMSGACLLRASGGGWPREWVGVDSLVITLSGACLLRASGGGWPGDWVGVDSLMLNLSGACLLRASRGGWPGEWVGVDSLVINLSRACLLRASGGGWPGEWVGVDVRDDWRRVQWTDATYAAWSRPHPPSPQQATPQEVLR